MAVAMEVAWRSGGDQLQLGSTGKNSSSNPGVVMDVMRTSSASKKRAWGPDTATLMHFMGKSSFSHGMVVEEEVREKTGVRSTLDLLGTGDVGGDGEESILDCAVVDEFLGFDPDQPLPSGWEKCLDLKTGELYFVNKSTGARTSEDPRKHQRAAEALIGGVIEPRTPARPAHEFLASSKEETLRKSTSRVWAGEDTTSPLAVAPILSFATGKRLWNLQLDDRTTTISVNKTGTSWNSSPRAPPFPRANSPSPEVESNLELNLNLSPSRSPSRSSPRTFPFLLTDTQAHTVNTVEMVKEALKRTEKAMGKRHERSTRSPLSKSPSFSSTSSSSDDTAAPRFNCEAECSGAAPVELVMGACTRCHQFVMVNKNVPKCPCCESQAGLKSFSSQSSAKRQRVNSATVLQ